MRRTLAILRTNLAVLWLSPFPYVAGAALHLLLGIFFVDQLRARERAVLQPLFPLAGFLLLALVPLVTMRSFADERRSGTLELVRAVPVPPGPLVAGKFLACWFTALAILAPAVVHVGLVELFGEPDVGPAVAGFVGLALLAAALCGIGIASSASTANVPVAAAAAFFATLVLWFANVGGGSLTTSGALAHLSLSERLRSFAGGGIVVADAGHLAAVAGVALGAAVAVLGARRSGALVVALGVVLAVATDRWSTIVDLTAERTLTLTDETREIVEAVDADVEVTAFLRRDEPGREEAAVLLDRYVRLNRHISYRLVDPVESPGEARRLGVEPAVGGVAVESGGERELVATASEADVTTALARLQRDVNATICIASGHGELDPDSTLANGFSGAAGLWQRNGYDIAVVDLLARPSIPELCASVVVAFPTTDFGAALDGLAAWVADGGRLLLLSDPDSPTDVDPLLAPYGLGIDAGVVVEGDPANHFPDDPTAPILTRYSSGNPVVQRIGPTIFPVTQGVVVDDDRPSGEGGLVVSRLADTSPASRLQRDDGTVEAGPITVMGSADKPRVDPRTNEIIRTRVLVTGDADFATNAFLEAGGNSQLLVRAADWLTVDENLVIVSTHLAAPRPLALTQARRTYALALTAGIVPGLFILAGGLVWAARRGR